MSQSDEECAICYQKMVLPLKLKSCGHSFCFLCIKSVVEHDTAEQLCPMCRAEIDLDQFKCPRLPGRLDMRDPEDGPSPMRKDTKSSKSPVKGSAAKTPTKGAKSSPAKRVRVDDSDEDGSMKTEPGPEDSDENGSAKTEPGEEDSDVEEMVTEIVVDKDEQGNVRASAVRTPKRLAAKKMQAKKKEEEEEKEESKDEDTEEEPGSSNKKSTAPPPHEKRIYWLYEGNKGSDSWWRFDPRLEKDMETAWTGGTRNFDVTICGHTYHIDLDSMQQERADGGGYAKKRALRRIEGFRELKKLKVRGISGVRLTKSD